ncbi:MAG: ComEC/Rec2 family competence protein [Spirochaetia bacterium]|nr:ComEC/Rec2 family competence protein [Spirochaetia bacterium]
MATAFVVYMPPGPWPRMVASLLATIMFIATVPVLRQGRLAHARLALLVLSAVLGLGFGAVSHGRSEATLLRQSHGFSSARVIAYEGKITGDPRRTTRGLLAFEVSLTAAVAEGGAKVTAAGTLSVFVSPVASPRGGLAHVDTPELTRGQAVVFATPHGLTEPRSGQGAWTDALAHGAAFVGLSDIHIIGTAPPLERLRARARAGLLEALRKAGGSSGPLLEALVVGVRDDLDGRLADDFRKAGCAHILALSGQHVGILAGLTSLILGVALGPFRARVGACLLAGFFLYLVGPSPSVSRAVFMFWIKCAMSAADRPQTSLALLCMSFVLALALWPQSAYALSFRLSYLAVAGIVVLEPSYEFSLRKWLPPPLSGAIAMGLAALVATAPLSVMSFGYLNPFSPLTSAVAGVLVTAFLWAGLACAMIVGILPAAATLCSHVCGLPYLALSGLMGLAARAPSLHDSGGTLAVVVALAGSLVYAWPHVCYLAESRHRASAGQLRLSQGTIGPPREPGTGHAQEVWPELPHKRPGTPPYSRPLRYRTRSPRLGNRTGHRINDP